MKPILLIVALLLAWIPSIRAEVPETPVSKVDRKVVRLPIGSNKGLKAGMWLDVFRQEERILHPITGEELGAPKVKIAEVQITRVFRTTALAKITMNYAPIVAGDLVREVGSVPMESPESPGSGAPASRRTAVSEEIPKTADRLAWEISEIRANIASLSKTLGRITNIERSVARMRGDLGAMQSSVASLKQEVDALKEKATAPQVVTLNRDNLAEFKVKHANLNIAVRSGSEPMLIPVEAFAQMILPYVKEEQQAVVDSLLRQKYGEAKAPAASAHGAEASHAPAESPAEGGHSQASPRGEEDPMAELQKLLDEGKNKPAWKVYLETYGPFGAIIGVFLGLVIVVVKLIGRRKRRHDDEEEILSLEEEEPGTEGAGEEEEEETADRRT
jgi:hypothetical protein